MSAHRVGILIICVAIAAALTATACQQQAQSATPTEEELIERGRLLVMIGDCQICHSPKIFTEAGPEPDSSRMFMGHPADEPVPPIPAGVLSQTGWGALGSYDFTAWGGPWGVSFAANITPHEQTGIGAWTEETFIKTFRTGHHLGTGRPILPPMPWQNMQQLSDDDLRAVFAFLKTFPPIDNRVPDPIPPAAP